MSPDPTHIVAVWATEAPRVAGDLWGLPDHARLPAMTALGLEPIWAVALQDRFMLTTFQLRSRSYFTRLQDHLRMSRGEVSARQTALAVVVHPQSVASSLLVQGLPGLDSLRQALYSDCLSGT